MGKHFANGPSAEHQATAAHSFAQAPEPARPYGAYSRAPRASYQGSGFDDSNFGKPKKKHTAAKVILTIVPLSPVSWPSILKSLLEHEAISRASVSAMRSNNGFLFIGRSVRIIGW